MNLDTTAALEFIRSDRWTRRWSIALIVAASGLAWWGILEVIL